MFEDLRKGEGGAASALHSGTMPVVRASNEFQSSDGELPEQSSGFKYSCTRPSCTGDVPRV